MKPTMRLAAALALMVVSGGCGYSPPSADEPHAILEVRWSVPAWTRTVEGDFEVDGREVDLETTHRGPFRIEASPVRLSIDVVATSHYPVAYDITQHRRSRRASETVALRPRRVRCRAELAWPSAAGERYILDLGIYEGEPCVVRCYRQAPGDNGSIVLEPCG